jgi:hypothetical protein
MCLASPGQFSDEVAIQGKDFANNEFSLFAPRSFVYCEREPEHEAVEARVQVQLLDQRDGLSLVRLPGRMFDNGSTVTVRADQLTDLQTRQCV